MILTSPVAKSDPRDCCHSKRTPVDLGVRSKSVRTGADPCGVDRKNLEVLWLPFLKDPDEPLVTEVALSDSSPSSEAVVDPQTKDLKDSDTVLLSNENPLEDLEETWSKSAEDCWFSDSVSDLPLSLIGLGNLLSGPLNI
ncbi:hypothetical protein WICPIJ_000541 [Wickerhamomyces pijperi]|uniref:Uncharacterized protein n=1 Tax=Wickerhamomyces pijperi TaxID=599730 RepID=A0A9P8QCM2_WICPI|nr:hypothetical protein WICPIJ_000541 [Wickerhamomyces pijperi]